MNGIEEKAVDLLNKIESLVSQQSQPAWDTFVQLAKVTAIGDLAITSGLLVLAILFGMAGRYVQKTFNKKVTAYEEWRREGDNLRRPEEPDEDYYYPLVVVSWFISSICSIAATIMLLQVWMWVALVNPELAAARQIVEKFLR